MSLGTTGEQRVDLDFEVLPGNNYELLMTLGNGLAVTTNEINFPYEITDIARINRSTGTVATFYAYFYDWEIEYDYFCGRVFASIDVNEEGEAPTVDFSIDNPVIMLDDQGQASVTFTDLSENLVNYRWTFGDGFTSAQANPTNVYTEPGTYVVTLYGTDSEGCSNMAVKTIEVQAAVTSTAEQLALANQLQLFPNPAQDLIHLQMDLEQQSQVHLQVVDLFGKVVYQQDIGQIQSGIIPVDIAPLPTGTYLMNVRVGNTSLGKRFIKY